MPLEHLDEVTKNEEVPYAEWLREKYLYAWDRERKTLLKHGMKKGRTEGRAEGEEQKQKEIALRMLEAGYKPAEISKLTSLSEDEIGRLNGHLSARS